MPAIAWSASSIDIVNRCHNLRHPTRILYVRYSSRSWGASLFRGSWERSQSAVIGVHRESDTSSREQLTNLMATCWLLSKFVPSKMTPNEPSPIFLPTR